jgi:hypothetical protein
MALEALKAYVIDQLQAAREELQGVSNDDLTAAWITDWKVKFWDVALVPASRLPGNVHFLQLDRLSHPSGVCPGPVLQTYGQEWSACWTTISRA